jgi:hypothetical protein
MKRACIAIALAAGLWAASAEKQHIKRASLVAMEDSFDKRIKGLADDPYLLVSNTHGVYLDGYGAVFTAEVSLANGAGISPFHPVVSKEEYARLRAKKLERLPALRQCMRDMLLAASASLDEVPAGEQIALGVTLINRPGEDKTGIPDQILMHGVKSQLLDAKLNRIALDSVLKEKVF